MRPKQSRPKRIRKGVRRVSIVEADIENQFVKYAEANQCVALKLRIDGQNGFPDRTVLTPRGVVFMEFKTPVGKLRPMQRFWRNVLRKTGYEVHTPRSFEDAKKILDKTL